MNFITQISKYIFYISLVLNAILLMFLVGVLPFLLYISILANILLMWYAYQFVIENNKIEEDISSLFDNTEDFVKHLEQIHELEMYYGDQNLQNLINHSKNLINQYVDIQEKYYDVEIEFDEDEEGDYGDAEEEEEEEIWPEEE
jgi:hypothetical protein